MFLNHRNKTKGFTLIELLVVVSIIALLVSILLPALGKAKLRVRRTVCATHLKQIATATVMYCLDYDDAYPVPYGIDFGYENAVWLLTTGMEEMDTSIRYGHVLLMEYFGAAEQEIVAGEGSSWDILCCPGGNGEASMGWAPPESGKFRMNVDYMQHCGRNSIYIPDSRVKYTQMDPGVVTFADTVYCVGGGGVYDVVFANHETKARGGFQGVNSARVDGSVDWLLAGPLEEDFDLLHIPGVWCLFTLAKPF